MRNNLRGISLLELLIALILMAFIVLGFSSIELFSRYQVTSSDRRAKIQNEASYVLEHMAKNIMNATGTIDDPAVKAYADNKGVRVRVGNNWIAYHRDSPSQIGFYANATDNEQPQGKPDILAAKISDLQFTISLGNKIEVLIKSRWEPAKAVSADNPEVTMRSVINMPSVSTN